MHRPRVIPRMRFVEWFVTGILLRKRIASLGSKGRICAHDPHTLAEGRPRIERPTSILATTMIAGLEQYRGPRSELRSVQFAPIEPSHRKSAEAYRETKLASQLYSFPRRFAWCCRLSGIRSVRKVRGSRRRPWF